MKALNVIISMTAFAAVALTSGHLLATNLVQNGGFEMTTPAGGSGQMGYNISVTGWTTPPTGYNFIFPVGTADNGTGVPGQYGNLQLWGPGNGSLNGLTASPDGGNFLAADGAFQVEPVQQTINGLKAGSNYVVGFYWAGAQQYGFTSPTTEQWVVSLGSQTQSTAVLNNANHGFTGWMYQTFTFTADSASDVLSFLAVGTPAGVPPFSLLDGVSLNVSVPEPGTLSLLIGGLLGGFRFIRPKKKS